jgi:hypothetical protein
MTISSTMTARISDRLWLSAAVLAVHVFERTHRPSIQSREIQRYE